MDDSSVIDSNALSLGSSVASILGIKGSLRFRPHGSTQKAHVILRRVAVSEDSSDDGEVSNVVRFSLFAQKRIEVKPGKEILLTVASPDGRLRDQPVVLEGDILSAEDTSDEEDDTQVADEEDSFLPPVGEAIPPKMRRAWTKKADDVSLVIPSPERPAVVHSSIGVQVEPLYISISTQAQALCTSRSSQTNTMSVAASVQVDPPPPFRTSSAVQTMETSRYMNSDAQTEEVLAGSNLNHESGTLVSKDMTGHKGERSLSPMELDSPPDSPQISPSALDSPHESSWGNRTPVFSPTIVPDLIAKLDLPPTLLPALSDASNSGARDTEMSPIELKSSLHSHSTLPSDILLAQPDLSKVKDVEAKCHVEPRQIPGSGKGSLPEVASRTISSITDTNTPTKTIVRSDKSEIRNPFVSAGFMTEFVAPVDKLLPQEQPTETSTQIKAENTKPKVSTARKMSLLDRMSIGTPSSPPITRSSSSANLGVTQPTSIQQNAVASSSKVVLEKAIPTRPTHHLRLYSTRALEKSPAVTTGLGLQSQAMSVTEHSSPPPDPKSLAYISSGPSSNPLNIRPSAITGLRSSTPKILPTAPKTLAQTPSSAKKRMVVGAGWPFVKTTNGAGPAAAVLLSMPTASPPPPPPPAATPSQVTDLSNILSYSSPSPPAAAPPPLPSSAPQNKWKRVNSDLPPTTALNDLVFSTSPTTPCPPPVDGKQKKKQAAGKVQKAPLPEKAQTMSLKDRIAQPSASAPTTPAPSIPPITVNGRDLRSRISDASSLPKLQTASPMVDRRGTTESRKASTSPVTTRSPAVASSAPAQVPPATPTSSTSLTHPLPAKPVMSVASTGSRGVKRERPKSPDPTPESAKGKKRRFRWPTVDSNYSTKLLGEGPLGIRCIAFNSDGSHFALSCADRTIRIWNSRNRIEIARLSHNSPVVAVSWMDGDTGVVSLGEDGLVSKWTKSGVNHWQWAKVLDAGKNDRRSDDDQVCLAYMRDRVAVSFPRSGVKVWLWLKGTWQSQRSILRQNVTAIKFVDEGTALIGGTRDGVLWYCEIPNGTLRAYAFLKSKIQSLDLTPSGSHVLAGVGGCARLVGIQQPDNKGSIEQSYSCTETEARPSIGFGAVFATEGQAILFGSVEGCVLVWDRKRGAIVYGLEHDQGEVIQAAASFDGPTNREGYLVTGTTTGQLAWWSQPVAAPKAEETHKRAKVEA